MKPKKAIDSFMASLMEVVEDNEKTNAEALLEQGKLPLYPYQEDGVKWLQDNPRSILGDDMGLGKTIQLLANIKENDPFGLNKILIVSPKAAKAVWRNEIKKWLNSEDCEVIDSTIGFNHVAAKFAWPEKRFTICNYEQLRDHFGAVCKTKWGEIIFDEAHKLRNPKSAMFKGAKEICEYFSMHPIKFVTGTPLVNTPNDLWSLLHLMDSQAFPSRKRFIDSWFWVYGNQYVCKDPERFKSGMEKYMLRRMRDEVLDLPEVQDFIIPIELEGRQKRIYDQMRDNWMAEYGNQDAVLATVLITQILRLKQICLSDGLIIPGAEDCEGIKTEELISLLEQSTGKSVITSGFRRYLVPLKKKLEEAGFNVGLLVGGMDERKTAADITRFQDPNDPMNVFLLSTKAGGESITLTEASRFIFMDKPWTFTAEDQAFGRIYRNGQTKKVQKIYIKAEKTIEDYIESVIDRKKNMGEQLIPIADVRRIMYGE